MNISFVGGAYEGRSKDINSQKCLNLFPVLDQTGGKSVVSLMHTPGLTEYVDLGTSTKVRGVIRVLNTLYAVSGNQVFAVDSGGSVTTITGTLNSVDDNIFMAHNGSYVVIVDEEQGEGWYIDTTGTTMIQITDPDFPSAGSLTFQDTYFIVTAKDTGKFYISPSDDPSGDWSALDFATAEAHPDYAYVVKSLNRELWIFGDETTEVFYNSGNTDFPYERIPGSVKNRGIAAVLSVGEATDALYFLADDYSVYMASSGHLQKVSTEQIDYQIGKLASQDKAFGFCYRQEGHEFYVLSFPTDLDNKTFVYDTTTQMWHERATGNSDNYHPATCHAFFNRRNVVGHKSDGKLYYYDFGVFKDGTDTLNRTRRTQSIFNEKKNVFHHILEVEFEAGIGLISGQGSEPQAMLRWSDDGGHTWSNEYWVNIGKLGEYNNRARWKKLGRSRDRIYEVKISDPVKVVIIDADLHYTVGQT